MPSEIVNYRVCLYRRIFSIPWILSSFSNCSPYFKLVYPISFLCYSSILSNPGFILFSSFHSYIACINSDNHFTICTRKENRVELLIEGHQVWSKWFIHVQRTLESFHGKTTDDHDTTRLPFRLFFYIRGRHFSHSSLVPCPIYAYVNSNEIYELRINYALNVHRIINKLVIHRLLSHRLQCTVLFCCCSRCTLA